MEHLGEQASPGGLDELLESARLLDDEVQRFLASARELSWLEASSDGHNDACRR